MKRYFVSFTAALIYLLVMSLGTTVEVAFCPPDAIVSVDPTTITVVGNYLTINVEISGVVDLYGWEFWLRWDSTLLDVVDVIEGPFLKRGGDTFFTNKTYNLKGYILVDCTLVGDVPGVSGDGTLATVEFHVEEDGESVFDLYDTTLISSLEQAITHQSTDGFGIFTSTLVGDVNGDGIVDIYDAVTVAIAFGSNSGDENWNPAADLNDDNTVDIYDVVILAIHFGEQI